MMMMHYNSETEKQLNDDNGRLFQPPQIDQIVQVDDEGVFHYENEHESLEDEIFELHNNTNQEEHDVHHVDKEDHEPISEEVINEGGVMSPFSQ